MHDLNILSYLYLVSLWTLWCVLHSFFISKRFMDFAEGRYFTRFHRIVYNGFATITFLLLLLYERSLEQILVYEFNGTLNLVRIGFVVFAILIFIVGAMHYDLLQFAGFRQVRFKSNHSALTKSGEFVSTGLLQVIRHPWYAAAYLLIWSNSRQWYDTTLIVNTVFSVYLLVGTLLEEKKLVRQFGESYQNYQHEVSMYFPIKWLRKRQIL